MRNQHPIHDRPDDRMASGSTAVIAQAWQAQLAQAAQTSARPATLFRQSRALYNRFVIAYQDLLALSRPRRRKLLRTLGTSLAGAALALALSQTPIIHAASITVGGGCILSDAITAANTNAVAGSCTAGSGDDTIILAVNSFHSLSSVNNTGAKGPNGLPVITSVITITGNGATITGADGSPNFRIFQVTTGNLTLNNLTITAGNIGLGGSSGGGIYNAGTVTLNNSAVSGNTANSGGGIFNNGTLTVTNSTISGNTASTGGGFNNNMGTLSVRNSTISGNTANGGGGGLVNYSTLTVSNSTISGNTTSTGDGGGIKNYGGSLALKNSTISDNSAIRGSGIFNNSSVTMNNSIVASQKSGNDCMRYAGPFTSLGFNLDSDGSCSLAATGDISHGAANLGTLQINAPGTTATHALLPGSQAINAGNCSGGTITTDQRGVARPQGPACDIGAFEVKSINSSITQQTVSASYNPALQACGAAGNLAIHTVTPKLVNKTGTTFSNLFFKVRTLEYSANQGGKTPKLCNASTPGTGVGATLLIGDPLPGSGTLSPVFQVGLPVRAAYRFFMDLYSTSATAANTAQATEGEYLGSFTYEYDDNGQLIDANKTLFLPLIVR